MHVSIISSFSFIGRLLSGIGSDYLVKSLHMSRFWCVTVSSSIFLLVQVIATRLENPNFLWVLSTFTGLGYGALFGVYPALVADTFGVPGMSLNWGCMIMSPVVFGNLFNIAYGAIYDSHSTINADGDRECTEGVSCYRSAYWLSFTGSIIGLVVSLWSIRHEHAIKRQRELEERNDHQA